MEPEDHVLAAAARRLSEQVTSIAYRTQPPASQ